MQIRAIIIEDEQSAIDVLISQLEEHVPQVEILGIAYDLRKGQLWSRKVSRT